VIVITGARRSDVAAWLNNMFDTLHLPDEPSEEDLRACLNNGSILCKLMNKLNPGSISKVTLHFYFIQNFDSQNKVAIYILNFVFCRENN